jgi:chitodextrinase
MIVSCVTTQVDLAWDPAPPGRPVAHYTLYRSNAVAPFNPVVVQSIAGTSYSDPGLTPFTLYLYQVAGVDSDGVVGPRSAVLPVRTRDGTPPTAPSGLTAVAVSASRIDLAWTAASDAQSGISRYRVYRDGALVDSTSATSFFNVGLSATTSYTYHVIAVNGEGLAGPPSNNATATTLDGSPPTAPTGLVATPISTSRIDLTWSPAGDPESGIRNYRIYRNGTFAGTSATLAFADQGLTPNTTYTYEVSAVNGASLEGPRTPPVTATTLTPVVVPGNLTVNTQSQGSGIPAAGYQVEVSASGVLLTQPIGTTASVTFAGLVLQTYTVTLQNLPANCAVDDGPNPTSVVVTSGATVSITFRVRCQ